MQESHTGCDGLNLTLNLSTSSILAVFPAATQVWKKDGATLKGESEVKLSLLSEQKNSPHSEGFRRHVGLIHHRVGVNDPEGSEEEDEQVLAVHGQTRHQSVDGLHLLRLVLHLDDVEDGGLVVGTEYAAGNLSEEFLHDTGDCVEGEVLDVDEATLKVYNVKTVRVSVSGSDLLKEMDQFLHARLLSRSPEDLLLERPLLVELQQHHLQTVDIT